MARNIAQEYAGDVEKLGFKLMELIALSVGLEANRFNRFFEDQTTSFIRLNHYPPCPAPHLALGVGRHKDAGVLTILAQDDDVEGLEVKRKSDGKWIRVKSVPGSFIINVGDTIQVPFCMSKRNGFFCVMLLKLGVLSPINSVIPGILSYGSYENEQNEPFL